MAKRVVKAALWEYRDSNGKKHRVFFGDEVDLPESEIKRGDAQGVFNPAPIPPQQSSELERALAGIEPRTPEPVLAGADDLPPPPHDVQSVVQLPDVEPEPVLAEINQSGVGGAQPVIVTPETVLEAPKHEPLKRPAKAAHVDVWRAYVVAATAGSAKPITEDQAADMSKEELQAAAPKAG